MSYYSRVYRHRNPKTNDENGKEPFFSKQSESNNSEQKSAFFQAKLSVNAPGDKYEQEADSVANAVVNQQAKAPVVQQKELVPEKEKMKGIQKKNTANDKKKKKVTPVQTKQETTAMTASPSVSSKIESSSGKGNSLPGKTQHEMSASFGTDLSNVKVHNDSEAQNMNQELQSEAFTHGSDIYFNKGKYNPENKEGKFLLAHELTHVLQQNFIQSKSLQLEEESFCPNGEVNDTIVQSLIDNALASNNNILNQAFFSLRNQRESRCCDLNLAAAEHYMWSRLQVAEGLYSFFMIVQIIGYDFLNLFT